MIVLLFYNENLYPIYTKKRKTIDVGVAGEVGRLKWGGKWGG